MDPDKVVGIVEVEPGEDMSPLKKLESWGD